MSVKDLCRLCAKSDEYSKNLLDYNNKSILVLIDDLLKIRIEATDNLSTKICLDCEEKLITFHLFILECDRVQETYHKLLHDGLIPLVKDEAMPVPDEVLSHLKSEVKDEFSADEIVCQLGQDTFDDFKDFGASVDNCDNDSSLEDITIASLKKLKKKNVKHKKQHALKLPVTQKDKSNNLKVKDFVRMVCQICLEEFKNFDLLRNHCSSAHEDSPILHCICGFEIKSKSVLYKHVSDHRVDVESKKNNGEDGADTSYLKVRVGDLVEFNCHVCKKKCESYCRLKEHCQRLHKISPVVRCLCGVLLKSKTVMYKHIALHKNHSYSCDKCPKMMKSPEALEKHKQRHVPREDRIFKCSECEKILTSKESLKSHLRSHIPIEERKQYPCELCNLRFTTRSSCTSHQRIVHEKLKAYVCDLCGYSCGTNGELRQHRAIHSEDKPFVCTKCSKPFKTYSNLKTHMDTHEDTSYVCYVCSRVLNSRRTLRKHLLVHQTECRHVCSYCNKAFKRRQTLKVHLSTHTGDKPLSCKWCEERFAYASTLRSHRLRYHPEKMAAPAPHASHAVYATYVPHPHEENLKNDMNIVISKINSEEVITR